MPGASTFLICRTIALRLVCTLAYNELTSFVSDPSTDTSPIAVDFYNITDRGSRYGPLGQLTPLAHPPGSGYFECDDHRTIFYADD
jgi:hypothetical protein